MKAAATALNPIQTFYGRPTPSNAVALAIADARAYCDPLQPDGDFLKQMYKAKERCEAYPRLVESLRAALKMYEPFQEQDDAEQHNEYGAKFLRSAKALLRELGEDE